MATLTARRSIDRPTPGPVAPSLPARAGMAVWRLFTSVNFAVVQIMMLALLAVVGMTVRQLPGFAFRSAGDYATQMNNLRAIYDPVPWYLGLVILAVLYLGLVHLLNPNGPGGLRAFAGEPTDDLAPAIADDLTRRNLGTGDGE